MSPIDDCCIRMLYACRRTQSSCAGGICAGGILAFDGHAGQARLEARRRQADAAEKGRLRAQWNDLHDIVYSEKLGEMASEFDRVHSVYRALSVGALNHIIPPANLRQYLVHAVERGMRSEESESGKAELEVVEAA